MRAKEILEGYAPGPGDWEGHSQVPSRWDPNADTDDDSYGVTIETQYDPGGDEPYAPVTLEVAVWAYEAQGKWVVDDFDPITANGQPWDQFVAALPDNDTNQFFINPSDQKQEWHGEIIDAIKATL